MSQPTPLSPCYSLCCEFISGSFQAKGLKHKYIQLKLQSISSLKSNPIHAPNVYHLELPYFGTQRFFPKDFSLTINMYNTLYLQKPEQTLHPVRTLKGLLSEPTGCPKISHILGRGTSSAWINKPCVITLRKQWWASHHVQLELFYMRIVGVEDVFRRDQRQLFDVHKQAPDVLSGHRCHVNYVSAVSEHPQVTGIYSLEAVPAEGAGLWSWAPANQDKYHMIQSIQQLYLCSR